MRILNRLILFGAIMLLSVASYGQNKRVRGNYAGPAYAGLAVVIDTLGYTVVDSAATPAIQVDTTFEGALLQYDTLTDTWESVNRAAVLGYKEYVALLSQTGTSAPTATVLYNDLGGAIVWAYQNVGEYTGTLTGAFVLNKTALNITGVGTDAPYASTASLTRNSANEIGIVTTAIESIDFVGGEVVAIRNGILNATLVTIRVYN